MAQVQDDGKIPLWDRMRARVKLDRLPPDHELSTQSDMLERLWKDYGVEGSGVGVSQFLAGWAKARMTWCHYSGEALA